MIPTDAATQGNAQGRPLWVCVDLYPSANSEITQGQGMDLWCPGEENRSIN